jgi:NADPH:quinone reductase-like Zn-dependent oxidoreductase
MATQTVYRLAHRNGFDGIRALTEPIPTPGPHEIVLKIHAVSLNYRDVLISTSAHPFPMPDNIVPCSDMAGEVVQVGSSVEGAKFAVGDKAILPISLELLYGAVKDMSSTLGGPEDGVLREYIAVPAHAVVKLPNNAMEKLGWLDWACLVTTGGTVWNAFYGGGKTLKPGMSVLVQGIFLIPWIRASKSDLLHDRHWRGVSHSTDLRQSRRGNHHCDIF